MDDKNYKSILMKSPFGFAYHKIIVDNQGVPVDYEFLEVNPAFERITGLKAKDIIGKNVCEVLPGIREDNFDWVQYYGDIALDGGDGEFEHYSKHLGSWYKVHAYSDQKHYFSTVFTDTTARKTLSDIAATFNNFSAQTINLQYLADKAREISGAAYAVLNKFDEDGRGSSTLAFSGLNKHLEKAISMLGFDPRGKRWNYDPVRQKKIDNQKTTVFQQLSDLTGTAIPPKIIALISKTLNIGQVAVVKSTRENIMLGDFTLIFKRGTQLQNRETIETYADLTGMLLCRIDEERKVINEQARLKTITDNMTDVVWESDLQFINTYTSPSVNRIFGFSVEEYMPITITERLAPESLQIALRLLQEELEKENDPLVSKSRSRLVELEYYKKDGSIISMESNISFIRDKNGKPVGLRGVSRDITERKQAEEKMRKSQKVMAQAEELAALGSWEWDIKNDAWLLSDNWKRIHGVPDIKLTRDQLLPIAHPEDRPAIDEAFNRTVSKGEPYEIQHRIIRQDTGEIRCVQAKGVVVFDDTGKPAALIGAAQDITERKQAENELKLQNVLLKTQQEVSLDGILIVDENDKIISFNQRFADIWEIPDEIMALQSGEKALQYVLPKLTNPDEFVQGIRDLHNNKQEKSYQEVFLTDGKILERYSSPLSGSADEYYGRIWYYRDITERKQSELLLNERSEEIAVQNEVLNQANQELITAKTKVEESETRFRQVSETAQELIWEVDYNGLYTYVSSVIESLLGYTPDEVVGKKHFYDLFFPEKREEYKQAAFEIFAQREAVRNFENTMVHKNGQLVIVKTAGTPFFDDEGNYMGYRGIDEDITERKQAEEALQKSNQRLETLLEISQKVTSTIDQDIIMQMIVNNAIRLIGLDTGAIYLKRDDETVSLSATTPALSNNFPNDLRNAYLKNHPHLNKALQTGKHVLMEDALSAKLTSEEKKIVDLRELRTILYQPIMIREEPMGALILSSIETPRNFTSDDLKMLQAFANQAAQIIDNVNNYTSLKKHTHELEKQIKQREKAEKELIIAKEKAEESDRLKTAFINNISHEIRTPLNSILGFGQFLVESDLSEEERRGFFEHVEKSGNRLMNTVTDYMDMAMLVANTVKVNKKDFALEAVWGKITAKTKKLCADKNIEFKLEIPKDVEGLTLNSDPEFIQKILEKLLDNAIKFTKEGGITCGCIVKTEHLAFFVKDTGSGIDEDKLDLIFEEFRQADTAITRGHEGSGLGLTIAKGLITLLGGEISVASEKGKGSAFTFTIPLKNSGKSISPDTTSITKPKNTKKPLILIAEDDESNYAYLAVVLKSLGCNHIHAANGKEAVDFCRQNPEISIVLMDIKMPVMQGDEATRLIRTFRPELPIIATTAHAQTGDRSRILEAGCDEYLSKPVKLSDLQIIIKKYLLK